MYSLGGVAVAAATPSETKRRRGRRREEKDTATKGAEGERGKGAYRVIKFYYRAVAIDCFRARANKHGAEPMKVLAPLAAAISTLVFANERAATDRSPALSRITHRDCAS